MSDIDLTAAIEAGAEAAYEAAVASMDEPNAELHWEYLSNRTRSMWLTDARVHIEAALPELRKAIAAEILAAEPQSNPNPRYRERYVLTYPEAAAIVRGQSGGSDGA